MTNVFQSVRERVDAQTAARFYGVSVNDRGWAVCPFHSDHRPSMSFKDGRFRCWACQVGGDAVDFVGRLFGLRPLDAVRRLDADFHLGLVDKPMTREERQQAAEEARRAGAIRHSHQAFEAWRESTVRELNECVRLGNLVERYMGKPDNLSPLAALALRERERMEYLSDALMWGSPEEQAQVWADRKGVRSWIERILNNC